MPGFIYRWEYLTPLFLMAEASRFELERRIRDLTV